MIAQDLLSCVGVHGCVAVQYPALVDIEYARGLDLSAPDPCSMRGGSDASRSVFLWFNTISCYTDIITRFSVIFKCEL